MADIDAFMLDERLSAAEMGYLSAKNRSPAGELAWDVWVEVGNIGEVTEMPEELDSIGGRVVGGTLL